MKKKKMYTRWIIFRLLCKFTCDGDVHERNKNEIGFTGLWRPHDEWFLK